MHLGIDHRAQPGPAPIARLALLLLVMIALVLGGILALEYPKFEPACGPQPRFAEVCRAVSGHAVEV